MDANHTASGKRLVVSLAVVIAFAWTSAAAWAEAPVRTPAPVRPAATRTQEVASERGAGGSGARNLTPNELGALNPSEEEGADAVQVGEAAVLAALLLIPPPIDLITEIPTNQPDDTHPIVVEGPDLHIDTIPGGVNGQVLHTQAAPEPGTLVLGVIGSGLAAAGAWYRRKRASQRAKAETAPEHAVAA